MPTHTQTHVHTDIWKNSACHSEIHPLQLRCSLLQWSRFCSLVLWWSRYLRDFSGDGGQGVAEHGTGVRGPRLIKSIRALAGCSKNTWVETEYPHRGAFPAGCEESGFPLPRFDTCLHRWLRTLNIHWGSLALCRFFSSMWFRAVVKGCSWLTVAG